MRSVRAVSVYVENGIGMADTLESAAWVFDLGRWGQCGQGGSEAAALGDLRHALSGPVETVVTERMEGDEGAFARDCMPCTDRERQATVAILREIRPQTIALLRSCSDAQLDFDDPLRVLPSWASWRTLRQMGWHVADTESRYYLPNLDLGYRERAADLFEELELSAEHVQRVVEVMPADLVVEGTRGTWTSTKVLRRLTWHERGELVAMRAMLAKMRTPP